MLRRIFCWFIVVALPVIGSAQTSFSMDDLAFMHGSWSLKTEKGRIVESWKKINHAYFEGISYSIGHSGDSILLETVKLRKLDGAIFFIPTGYAEGNNSTIAFKLISAENNTFIFENKEHDFPTRIVYRSVSDDKILAWIEGSVNGKLKKIEYPYSRESH